ncbi:hypothetical protein F5148DRAFT_1278254 [Russula earlei]|uniref:Uncharacterized protein n=1 Tax=Russula earlei TaxID=71964 RepID=A0ACC0TTV4_9AGAM|nr:hypothetical protein F5148DRAFT_1278254 [Russula earlei]
MFLVSIIPGPREPSLEQINHILAPLVYDLLCFWEPGVFIRQTAHHFDGHLCQCGPNTCGFASHAFLHFCSFCKLPLHEIDNLDANSWPIRTWAEHRQSACAWKDATSHAARLRLYCQNGIRWSKLLRLPYWDPTTFVVLDCMHSLLLGNLQRHCREVWGMNFQLEDNDFHLKPDKKGAVTKAEILHGYGTLEHGTDQEVASLSIHKSGFNMPKTTLPSWIGRAPPKLGDGRHGKLSVDQWRTACTINLVVTLGRLWGSKPPNDCHYQMLVNFTDLTTPDRIVLFQQHMHRYLQTMKELYVYSNLTPNHHLALHLPKLLENFGPPHAWVCFVFECCL